MLFMTGLLIGEFGSVLFSHGSWIRDSSNITKNVESTVVFAESLDFRISVFVDLPSTDIQGLILNQKLHQDVWFHQQTAVILRVHPKPKLSL